MRRGNNFYWVGGWVGGKENNWGHSRSCPAHTERKKKVWPNNDPMNSRQPHAIGINNLPVQTYRSLFPDREPACVIIETAIAGVSLSGGGVSPTPRISVPGLRMYSSWQPRTPKERVRQRKACV